MWHHSMMVATAKTRTNKPQSRCFPHKLWVTPKSKIPLGFDIWRIIGQTPSGMSTIPENAIKINNKNILERLILTELSGGLPTPGAAAVKHRLIYSLTSCFGVQATVGSSCRCNNGGGVVRFSIHPQSDLQSLVSSHTSALQYLSTGGQQRRGLSS